MLPCQGGERVVRENLRVGHQLNYAFPPFGQIGRVLKKVQREQATMIIITPGWQSQAWFPKILQMCVAKPLLLPCYPKWLTDNLGNPHPLTVNRTLKLMPWLVSGNAWRQNEFQSGLQTLSHTAEERVQHLIVNRPRESGYAGMIKENLIPMI